MKTLLPDLNQEIISNLLIISLYLCYLNSLKYSKINIYKRLISVIENHYLLSDGKIDKRTIDIRECPVGVFIDMKKATDTVDHKILINTLQCFGIFIVNCIAIFVWHCILRYFTNRSHYVCYNSSNSEVKIIKCGVLQGSILGPILFILYINA